MESLQENPNRRFIYVEIAYFWRWWNQQTEDMKNTVKQYVNTGRLEFISGGWCMHDEGATHYNSIIDQMSLGAEFLRNEFGDCARPKIGWQIDPFGHSRESASLLAQVTENFLRKCISIVFILQMGFDGLIFWRADYQDIEQRSSSKTMELMWKASANLDRQSWLFTSILLHDYGPPGGFCFDYLCEGEPIMVEDMFIGGVYK